jgi:tetratricopeptide (TPR) repeat protein
MPRVPNCGRLIKEIRRAHDPGPLCLSGICGADRHAITDRLLELSSSGALIAADLSLGAWRHFQVAHEIFAQLGLEGRTSELVNAREQMPSDPALPPPSRVGQRIDRETRGDRVALDAFRMTGDTVRALKVSRPMNLCVVTAAHGLGWEPADVLFIRFLAQALRSTEHRILLVFCGHGNPELPRDWIATWSEVPSSAGSAAVADSDSLLHLVPGIITPEIAGLLDPAANGVRALIPLAGGCFLVPGELRRELGSAPREQYDRLVLAAIELPSLASYANFWGNDSAVNPTLLWEHGRAVFDAGGLNIAIRLLDRAIRAARTPAEQAVFEILAHGARILSGRFKDIAATAEPDERLPAELRGWLWFTKGWGLAMLEKPTEAEPCLQQARDLLGNKGETDEFLYVLNISALNRLKTGDWDGALAMEQRIRSTLEGITSGRWQIAYINSLNLARLYRRRVDFGAAEQCYLEAFSTSFGAWSDSDALYLNVCLTRLYEGRRRYRDALHAWARAALYWVSSAVPEAIASRVTGAIIGHSAWGTTGNLIDDVSVALVSRLLANARAAGLGGELSAMECADPSGAPAFVKPGLSGQAAVSAGTLHALRIAGCWVFGMTQEVAPIVDSEANRRLRATLALLVNPSLSGDGVAFRTILVDDRLGCGLPETQADMLAASLRLGVQAVRVAGRCLKLDGTAGGQARAHLRVRLANTVSRVMGRQEGVVVTFKRYLEPQTLSGAAASAVRTISDLYNADIRGLPCAAAQDFDMSLLRELERERIVDLFLPEDVSVSAFTNSEGR